MNKKILIVLTIIFLFAVPNHIFAATDPMLKSYTNYEYGKTGERLEGIVPALNDTVPVKRAWELSRWTGVVNYPDKTSVEVPNYDVFNVKKAEGDSDFDKENGFGLVYKSPEALGELFDAFTSGQLKNIDNKQQKFYRDSFVENANDEAFQDGHPFFYSVEKYNYFLRTAGIIQRMGYKFDRTQKYSEDDRRAYYTASKWPELKVVPSSQSFTINYSTYGFSDRKVRLIATAKGAFPNLKRVVSLTDGKLISATKETETGTIKVSDFAGLRQELGNDIDVVLEDGYGRTAIQSVKLPEVSNLDFIPTSLTLTEGNQLWVKFKYEGDDFTSADYINDRGIPMIAKVTVTGPDGQNQTLQGMYTDSSKKTLNGQTYSYYFGNVTIGDRAGRYKIKAAVTINNPNHEDRALEFPDVAYENNTITDEWTRDYTDLVAQSVDVNPDQLTSGDTAQVTAKVKNVGPTTQGSVLIRFYDNGETVYEATKTMPANEVITVGPFTWKGQGEGTHNLMVDVDPEQDTDDVDFSNNTAIGTCLVVGKDGSTGTCQGPSVSNNWTVTYPTITGYKKSSKGKKRPIWEYKKVTYNESLKIAGEVNTKQGIATDLDHPKASDAESRGSWEIIPWAKQNGKNPNEVTRAGYGFELNVTTTYDTNWETKVPNGYEGTAKKIGGTYHGPSELYAEVFDTQGKLIKKLKLDRVGGDQDKATWAFPKQTTTSPSGATYTDRKFYTDMMSPDGTYKVKITSGAGGKSGMIVCMTKTITIHGGMHDDTQDLRTYSSN